MGLALKPHRVRQKEFAFPTRRKISGRASRPEDLLGRPKLNPQSIIARTSAGAYGMAEVKEDA